MQAVAEKTVIVGKPELSPLKMGKSFKTFQITGKQGMKMPSHLSTKETVVSIQKGSANLKMADGECIFLEEEDVFIIPGGKVHSLELTKDFKAIAIMATDSEIKFTNNI